MCYFTVFTPTYNRAYILGKAYNSLLNQTYKEFIWVIMDDGSEDNTEKLVQTWINEKRIKISYHKQRNQGRFFAQNNALPFFQGELVAFLDSDDQMKPKALETIHRIWERSKNDKKEMPVGLIAYMQYPNGKIIGNEFPSQKTMKCYELRDKYKVTGDKWQVYKRQQVQCHPYPIYEGEKFIGDSYMQNRINENGPMVLVPDALYVRDYPADGLTKNILKVHYNSPKSMALYYKETMKYYKTNIKKKTICALKYVSFCKIARQKVFCDDLNSKALILCMYLPGTIYAKILKVLSK